MPRRTCAYLADSQFSTFKGYNVELMFCIAEAV
jgi:hypothetical protein